VYWVGGNNCGDLNVGDREHPFCSVNAAISKAKTRELVTIRINNEYSRTKDESIVIGVGREVALIGELGEGRLIEMLQGKNALTGPALKVAGSAKAWVRGLSWKDYALDGVECAGLGGQGQLWMERVSLKTPERVGETGNGLNASDCAVQVKRAEIVGNRPSGVRIEGGEIWLENVIVAKNRSSQSESRGIYVGRSGILRMNHVTVASNGGVGVEGTNIFCEPGASKLEIRNSLVLGSDFSFNDCSLATSFSIEQSVIDDSGIKVSGTSKILSNDDASAVTNHETGVFEDPENFDYHLDKTSDHLWKLAGVVTHGSADPAVDFEGKERPAEGQADYPGADQPD
jgi:hypothetical protein